MPRTSTTKPKRPMVSAGPGWGGERRGAGAKAPKAPKLERGNKAAAGPHDMSRAEKLQFLKDHLFHLATNAEREDTQVRATEAYLDREEGQPLRKVQVSGQLDIKAETDEQLNARIAQLLEETGIAPGGTGGTGVP